MSMLDAALAWAARGFRVFPLAEGTKDKPLCKFATEATTDVDRIAAWWRDPLTGAVREHNVGMLTTGMVVVDIDTRNGKPGLTNFLQLGGEMDTLTVRTPSGGYHCYYNGPDSAGRQGKYGLGGGLDIRSHANYVVAPGSRTVVSENAVEGTYDVVLDVPLKWVPDFVASRLKAPLTRDNVASYELDENPGLVDRAVSYLLSDQAPGAVSGEAGDDTTYKTACRLRDLGLTEQGAFALLLKHWNAKCSPPWDPDELLVKTTNAYSYATGHVGSMSPETQFATLDIPPQPDPAIAIEKTSALFEFGNAVDPETIAPRPWLMGGLLMRRQITVLVAPGSGGKSTVALQIAAHLAMGHSFLGYAPKDGPTRSIIYDEEDDVVEQSRRLWSICQSFGFNFHLVRERVSLMSRRQIALKITEGDPPRIHTEHVRALTIAASAPDIGMISLNPFVSLHSAREDDNVAMAGVMNTLREITEYANVAMLLSHHVSKPSGANSRAGDMNTARGASSIITAARFAFTLYTPTEQECAIYGIKEEERNYFIRFDGAKGNMVGPDSHPRWMKKTSVRMPNGDDVGVLMPFDMQQATSAMIIGWATIIAAEMKGKATASCSMSDAADMLRAGDMLAHKLPAPTLRSRVMSALAEPVITEHGNIKLVKMMQGGKFTSTVVLE